MDAKETLAEMTPKQILACVDLCDGWTIFKPEKFIERGLPEAGVHNFVSTQKSDGSAKGSITDLETGKLVDEMSGIYGLDFLSMVARALDVEYEGKIGRGFQAQTIKRAMHKALGGDNEQQSE